MPAIDIGYCCLPPSLLKWLEIILMVAMMIIVEPFGGWEPYGFIMFVGMFCAIVTAVLLLIYFCDLHRSTFACGQWMSAEVLFNFVAGVMNFIVFGLTLYYAINRYGWGNGRYGALAGVSIIAGILYISSAGVFHRGGYIMVV